MAAYTARGLKEGWLQRDELTAVASSQEKEQEALTASAEVLRRPLLGAYILGAAFLARGNPKIARGDHYPVSDVAQVFREPPRSSEQVLHPEKYWDAQRRDEPIHLKPPDLAPLLGKEWSGDAAGNFGELFVGLLVGASTPSEWSDAALRTESWTNDAASGWGGDAWSLWINGDAAILAIATLWDSGRDAREFARAASDNPRLVVERDGRRVAVLAGDLDRITTKAALARVLRTPVE
jgi:hypothetical protein